MPTEITVRGSFSAFQPPERGTVHASVSYHGSEKDWVYDQVARDLDVVKESILRLEGGDDSAVTRWSAAQLRTWTNHPRNDEGEELPPVHVASVGIEVRFRDFTALSHWVGGHLTGTEGFELSRVRWALTSKSRDELIAKVQTGAVQDAAARAQLYADALELGKVKPLAIADPGMLGAQAHPEGPHGAPMLMDGAPPSGGGGRAEVELVPEDIRVSATVDARFVTTGT